ncbi:hypothetical protein KDAU_44360 [Dictyobacter aurantiacus]|uniref:Uncharacterized protein n=1 Tax=Dictyobacter aurantiacus TaxID=1936993 RepID=A0A401ZJR8_9CHLR|nr:hypothetical protein KDAU_44360 [Dictyobacter aurantiacus]
MKMIDLVCLSIDVIDVQINYELEGGCVYGRQACGDNDVSDELYSDAVWDEGGGGTGGEQGYFSEGGYGKS